MSLIALPHGQVATPFCCWRAVSQCLAVGLHQGHVDIQDVFKAGPGRGNNRPVQSAPLTEMSAPDEGKSRFWPELGSYRQAGNGQAHFL